MGQKVHPYGFRLGVVKTAFADMAPNQHMRRWRPRAQGRATRIVKGMSHITVVVSDGGEN